MQPATSRHDSVMYVCMYVCARESLKLARLERVREAVRDLVYVGLQKLGINRKKGGLMSSYETVLSVLSFTKNSLATGSQ